MPAPVPPTRVMIVDDHPAMRRMIRDACERTASLEVVGEAADGVEALDRIRTLQPDVVVLDLMLPGLTGLEIVKTLRGEGSPSRCLILSARDDAQALFEAVRADVGGFLDKSTDLDALVKAIEAVAAGRSIITAAQKKRAARQLGDFVRQTRASSWMAHRLSPREREVLRLIGEGLTTQQMATRLGITIRTVESHISSTYRKLKVESRVQAAAKAKELGLA